MGDAILEFEKVAPIDPGTGQVRVLLTAVKALRGETDAAVRLLAEFEHQAQSRFIPAMHHAHLYIALGDHSKAFAALDRARQNREDALRHAKVAFIFDPLREDARFVSLLKVLGLERRADFRPIQD